MKSSEYAWMAKTDETLWWFHAKRAFIAALLPAPRANLRILDIGPGTGGISSRLHPWGIVDRIESSPIAQKYLKTRKLNCIHADINTYMLRTNTYDLITCFDVLYHKHIQSDTAVLTKLFHALKPGGTILITDCAIPELFGPHDIRNEARERYRLREMRQKVRSCGFRITKASYTYFAFFPFFALSRIYSRFFPTKETESPDLPKLNNLFIRICIMEASLLKHISFPWGSSIILKAEKPVA